MLISCVTITQAGRLSRLSDAISDFARQTFTDRELIIIHDGGRDFDAEVRTLCAAFPGAAIHIHAVPAGATLGALRNTSVEMARGEFICQWDDDDRHHPMRIELQVGALKSEASDFCFLADQLHWFPATRNMSWDDWDKEAYPLNFVQGTLLGRRSLMPRYPELARGEDTALCLSILEADHRISRLRGVGWCYVYVYHGDNAWSLNHHMAISRVKSIGAARLLGRERILRERLAEYLPALGPMELSYSGGRIRID